MLRIVKDAVFDTPTGVPGAAIRKWPGGFELHWCRIGFSVGEPRSAAFLCKRIAHASQGNGRYGPALVGAYFTKDELEHRVYFAHKRNNLFLDRTAHALSVMWEEHSDPDIKRQTERRAREMIDAAARMMQMRNFDEKIPDKAKVTGEVKLGVKEDGDSIIVTGREKRENRPVGWHGDAGVAKAVEIASAGAKFQGDG